MIQTILRNGTIYTVEGTGWEKHPAEAMALTEDGVIAAVGTEEEILELREEQTAVLDLEGSTVLPGLIDSHAHMPGKAFAELFQINLFGIMDREPTLATIRDFIAEHPDFTEYFGMGFNMGMVDEAGRPPCATWLDRLCPNKPVQLSSYDMHSRWLNSKALEICAITKDTPDPAMGHIHRDENGNPTGLLTDCKSIPLMEISFTREQCVEATTRFVKTMNAWGYTAINSIAPHQQTSPYVYQDVQANGDLTARIATAQFIRHMNAAEDLELLQHMKKDLDSDLIKVTTAKYLIDGVVEGYTAYLKEPYDEAAGLGAGYNSYPEWTEEELAESFAQVMREGFSVQCHSIGDAATSMVLDALEDANASGGAEACRDGTCRNVITHLQLVEPSDIDRMAQLGVIAAIQPFWHFKEPGFYNTVELAALGKERAEKEYPARSFVDAGVLITASGDFPVSQENNPFYGIKAGVIRNLYNNEDFGESISDPDDERFLLGKEERLTVPQMIEAYTINGAYQMFREDEIGSLAPGKKADYIVVDRDPLRIDVMDLDKIQVLQTVFNGEVVNMLNKKPMLYKNPTAEQMKETYKGYIAAFQQKDWETLKEYVADNIYFYWGVSAAPLVGKDAFVGFFAEAAKYWNECPEPDVEDATVPILRVWIDNKITVFKDWENSPFEAFGMTPKAGDTYNPHGYVNYVFNEDGQIAIIVDCDYAH